MKALIVKEDGLIYAAEVPEEPEYNGEIGHSINVQKLYYGQLEVAKTNAILISDQEKAIGVLMLHVDHLIHKRPSLKPCIYPIPDLQWELEHRELGKVTLEEPASHTGTFWVNWRGGRTNAYLDDIVAILSVKEETVSTEQESQEVWKNLFTMLYDECEMNANIFSTEQMIDKLKPYFTITRKP